MPERTSYEPGTPSWVDLTTPDPAGAKIFYGELFGWTTEDEVDLEATGGYERTAFLLLWEAGIACGLTNPRSVRRYAEAMGVFEKTDRLDARIIARFAIAKDLKPNAPPTPGQQRLNALVARLCQITDDLVVQKQRRSSAMNSSAGIAWIRQTSSQPSSMTACGAIRRPPPISRELHTANASSEVSVADAALATRVATGS